MATHRSNVLAIFGTRPEAIKLAPIVRALEVEPRLSVRVVVTGQHREMLDQVLAVFGITPSHDFNVMTVGQSLPQLTSRLLPPLDQAIAAEVPAAILVQGDTTTAFAAALAAFYRRVPVGHVEAGLRSNDRYAPFPEEINRRLISALSCWHFAPTQGSRAALMREGVPEAEIVVTGNTVIDALYHVLATTQAPAMDVLEARRRLILVTAHRRENFGRPFEALCRAIRRIADRYVDVQVCYPVHPNPNVREPVERLLADHPRIRLMEPLDYVAFSHLLARAYVVITDSGGIQEEGPALGKPVLVMREVTERPEAVEAGAVELVGTDEDRIVARTARLLDDPVVYAAMTRVTSPYGDGHASERIVSFLRSRLATS